MTPEEKRAREIWRKQYGRSWPRGWRVHFMTCGATCPQTKEVFVLADRPEDAMDTLSHEFVHMRNSIDGLPDRHGPKFEREVRSRLKRVLK